MLKRFSKEEIQKRWELISMAIEKSMPPIASGRAERMTNIKNNLMLGTLQAWGVYRNESEDSLVAVGTTTVIYDFCSGAKQLLGYSIYSIDEVEDEVWADAYKELAKFAKEHKCENICAYTESQRVFDVAKQLGSKCSLYVVFPSL